MKGQRKEPACFIVGAGSFDGFLTEPQEGDLVIAADGGYAYLKDWQRGRMFSWETSTP